MAHHDRSGLHRSDTNRGPPLRILSLDGGGVRGYSMLILLQELMHRTFVEIHGQAPQRHQIPKPCEHFDLIFGTGTGGLIALMLGRLRLDIDTCKDVYVRMTRRVFQTDKTIAGLPLRSTLFKASKLEDAIRDCVSEHTIYDDEGNDTISDTMLKSPASSLITDWRDGGRPRRSTSTSSRLSGLSGYPSRPNLGAGRWGNPDALLYDARTKRTKTAVTAVYKGTPAEGNPALLRSYDSRGEPAPELNCTIWEAGRATSATQLAFKPIQVGQSIFLDEGAGKYNPAPQALDEAVINEWPGREVGIIVSVGTGKRPVGTEHQQQQWWQSFLGGTMGEFADARRRLMAKIEGCEETHQYMLREHLNKRGVNPENYFRLNVEVGVGEFGMNEWQRLSEISTNTRMYLRRDDIQMVNMRAASKMARIHMIMLAPEHPHNRNLEQLRPQSWNVTPPKEFEPPGDPSAVELPADSVFPSSEHSNLAGDTAHHNVAWRDDSDKYVVNAEQPQFAPQAGRDVTARPPPRPPKTPLDAVVREPGLQPHLAQHDCGVSQTRNPYGPPPPVNMVRKPESRPIDNSVGKQHRLRSPAALD